MQPWNDHACPVSPDMRDLMKLPVTVPHLCYSYNMPARKPKGIDWNGSLADFKDAVEIAGKVAYEVSGAGDVVRFAKDPSIKNAAALGQIGRASCRERV